MTPELNLQASTGLSLSLLLLTGVAPGQDSRSEARRPRDPTQWELEDFLRVHDHQEFYDRHSGLEYKVEKSRVRCGLRIRTETDRRSSKWARHGPLFELHPSTGRIRRRTTYVAGVRHGEEREYDSRGKLHVLAHYRSDKLWGVLTRYNSAGQVLETCEYRDGKRHGPRETYHVVRKRARGPIRTRTMYARGKKHGECVTFDAHGKVVIRAFYRHNRRVRDRREADRTR